MEPKTPYDRVTSSLTKQSILAFIFALLVASDLSGIFKILPVLTGIIKFIPVIICLIGIGFNIFLGFFSKDVEALKDFVYRTAPIILGVGWTALLVVFSLQAFGAV
jgi:hypothetical protein